MIQSQQPLTILVAGNDLELAHSLGEHLELRSHMVSITNCADELLALPSPDVLLLDLELSEAGGFALLAELRRRGNTPRVVLYAYRPTGEDYRAALRLGAADLLPMPFTFETVAASIEAASRDGRQAPLFRRTVDATAAGVDRSSREVAAWLLRCGVTPATRCRVASAVAEAVDNAARHAYLGGVGTVELAGNLDGGRLMLSIRDRGIGMHADWCNPLSLEDPGSGGLARICALAEDLSFESEPKGGTHLVLSFHVYQTNFDEGRGQDLSELDYLTPTQARNVLHNLSDPDSEPLHLSPSLAVSVGRLLAGPDPQHVLEISLRS